jgi:hypothetical protein
MKQLEPEMLSPRAGNLDTSVIDVSVEEIRLWREVSKTAAPCGSGFPADWGLSSLAQSEKAKDKAAEAKWSALQGGMEFAHAGGGRERRGFVTAGRMECGSW